MIDQLDDDLDNLSCKFRFECFDSNRVNKFNKSVTDYVWTIEDRVPTNNMLFPDKLMLGYDNKDGSYFVQEVSIKHKYFPLMGGKLQNIEMQIILGDSKLHMGKKTGDNNHSGIPVKEYVALMGYDKRIPECHSLPVPENSK